MKTVKQANIYIGLNDSETYKQLFETEKYISILKNVCKAYHVAFSMNKIADGCFHEDGTYVDAQSLIQTLPDVDENIISEIVKELCAFFHQESVLVTYTDASIQFVSEKI